MVTKVLKLINCMSNYTIKVEQKNILLILYSKQIIQQMFIYTLIMFRFRHLHNVLYLLSVTYNCCIIVLNMVLKFIIFLFYHLEIYENISYLFNL